MYWEAFIWGLGVSSGGAIGLFVFVMMLSAWQIATGKTAEVRKIHKETAASLAALKERNALSEEANTVLTDMSVNLAGIQIALEELDKTRLDTQGGKS